MRNFKTIFLISASIFGAKFGYCQTVSTGQNSTNGVQASGKIQDLQPSGTVMAAAHTENIIPSGTVTIPAGSTDAIVPSTIVVAAPNKQKIKESDTKTTEPK